jgi:hypothetical protein
MQTPTKANYSKGSGKGTAQYYCGKVPKMNEGEVSVINDVLCSLSRSYYLKSLGFKLFDWQRDVIDSKKKRKAILASRQAGKSTVVSSIPCHTAKYYAKSVSLILAPNEKQAGLCMGKVKDFISLDKNYPKITRNSDSYVKLSNGSEIYVVPATESAARGYSKPRCIIIDEASRVDNTVYTSGLRPMLTDNIDCELSILSTPHGKDGFFYKAFSKDYWDKYFIRTPFDLFLGFDGNYSLRHLSEDETTNMKAKQLEKGMKFYISNRHYLLEEQQENFMEMGLQQYKQEYLCEFVEPMDSVFSYEDIEELSSNVYEGGLDLSMSDLNSFDNQEFADMLGDII